jgi:hypothetical protein
MSMARVAGEPGCLNCVFFFRDPLRMPTRPIPFPPLRGQCLGFFLRAALATRRTSRAANEYGAKVSFSRHGSRSRVGFWLSGAPLERPLSNPVYLTPSLAKRPARSQLQRPRRRPKRAGHLQIREESR